MIEFTNVTLRINTHVLIEDFSCSITPKMHVGLIGKNGCGKTSLFNLILGRYETDQGHITINPKLKIAHVAQEITEIDQIALTYALHGDEELMNLRKQEDIALQKNDGTMISHIHQELERIDGYSADSRASALLLGLGFTIEDIQKPVQSFSGGWRMRLNIARALMCRSDILLLDEPTNHLDFETVVWLENWLKSYSGILIIISHDRDFLEQTCNHILHIEHQKALLYKGNYSDFLRLRSEKLALQQALYEKNEKTRAHLTRFIERFGAKATKARQAQSRVKALARLESIAPVLAANEFHFTFPVPERTPDPLLTMRDISVGYDTQAAVLSQVQLTLTPDTRIGILGKNGEGKSTLIKLIAGALTHREGEFTPSEYLKTGYFSQHQLEYLTLDESPQWHIQQLNLKTSTQEIRNFLGGFGFHGDKAMEQVKYFSGGEKARLALAMIVYERPNLLLLDEPTNHLDLDMREAIMLALQEFQGGVLMVSHDSSLLSMCCDQFILVHNKTVTPFDGDLSDYRTYIHEQSKIVASAQSSKPVSKTAGDFQLRKDLNAELKRCLRNKEKLEKEIASLQTQVIQIDEQLGNPNTYQTQSMEIIHHLNQEKNILSTQIKQHEEAWFNAEYRIDEINEIIGTG